MNKQKIDGTALRKHAEAASELLRTVGNPIRLMILCSLVDGEHSVGELNALIDIAPSALSQHLSVLRRDGLVNTRREAQTIHYSLKGHEVRMVMKCLYGIYCA